MSARFQSSGQALWCAPLVLNLPNLSLLKVPLYSPGRVQHTYSTSLPRKVFTSVSHSNYRSQTGYKVRVPSVKLRPTPLRSRPCAVRGNFTHVALSKHGETVWPSSKSVGGTAELFSHNIDDMRMWYGWRVSRRRTILSDRDIHNCSIIGDL